MGNCASVSLSVKSDPSGPPLPHAITSLAPPRRSLQAPLLTQAGLLGAGREAPGGSVSGAVSAPSPTNPPIAAPARDRPAMHRAASKQGWSAWRHGNTREPVFWTVSQSPRQSRPRGMRSMNSA